MKYTLQILLTIVLSICLFIYISNTNNKINTSIESLKSDLLEERIKIANMEDVRSLAIDTEGRMLPTSVIKNVPDSIDFILRLHDGICLNCYIKNLLRLAQQVDNSENLQMMILGSYNFTSQFNAEITSIGMKDFHYMNINEHDILPIDSIGVPYLFTLTQEGKAEHIYVFFKEDFKSVEKYLQLIERHQ